MANTVERGLVNKSALTAIGNAIRKKSGTTTKYKPSEMAAAISNLKTNDILVATSDKFNFKVVQSVGQIIKSTPTGVAMNNSDGTVSLALTDTTTISPNTGYIPGAIKRSYDDSTHTYTVAATNAEPIDGLVQDGWSVVYQKSPDDNAFYPNADYTGTATTSENLQGNILIGGMQKNSAENGMYPAKNPNIIKFKNTFITSTGIVLGELSALVYAELPNLTTAGDGLFYGCGKLPFIELPNLTTAGDNMFLSCDSLRSIETPKLMSGSSINMGGSDSISSPNYFIDIGYATDFSSAAFFYNRITILRAPIIPKNFIQTALSDPVLYIVPSALVNAYKSKVRSGDYVTALEKSPFADGKTVCGNNMKTAYNSHVPGTLRNDISLFYNTDVDSWEYVQGTITQPTSGFYFLSKLTKSQSYTIPT